MKRIPYFLMLLCSFVTTSFAQSPKREFRAAWIATVSNIDWPSKPGLPAIQQQQEFINRLDQLKEMGCNAVIVQIRPALDAFYPSSFEPWSRYLTGRQGQPPFPYYDPLKFMIDQAHDRNMEFHAWFNPYRALTDSKKNPNPPGHVTRTHPDWVISYGGKSYLDPGLPEVREYSIRVIMDVVKRYDIDAVHMDDYFYPYRVADLEFGDQRSFMRYGQGFSNKNDWRRGNVDLFISSLNANIKQVKPRLKFGISPFGVWRNASKDPDGSNTRGGQTNYDDLYADVILWMRKGWIDYLLPQLYWEHNHKLVAFDILFPWWDAHSYGRHVYYGLGVYRMVETPRGAWAGTGELMWQLRDIRRNAENPGHVFYSASSFEKARAPIADSVKKFNSRVAFPPVMKWLDSVAPAPPILQSVSADAGILLKWETTANEPLRFAVYRFGNGESQNLERTDRIVQVLSGTEFLDATAVRSKKYNYVVTAFDRLWNESKPSNTVTASLDR
jgi:uncharacterized lipoprotein YddW (UPF0748 family)